MHHSLGSVIRFSAGMLLIMIGVIGLIIPILQSAVLIVIGLPLVSPEHGKQLARWVRGKFIRSTK